MPYIVCSMKCVKTHLSFISFHFIFYMVSFIRLFQHSDFSVDKNQSESLCSFSIMNSKSTVWMKLKWQFKYREHRDIAWLESIIGWVKTFRFYSCKNQIGLKLWVNEFYLFEFVVSSPVEKELLNKFLCNKIEQTHSWKAMLSKVVSLFYEITVLKPCKCVLAHSRLANMIGWLALFSAHMWTIHSTRSVKSLFNRTYICFVCFIVRKIAPERVLLLS